MPSVAPRSTSRRGYATSRRNIVAPLSAHQSRVASGVRAAGPAVPVASRNRGGGCPGGGAMPVLESYAEIFGKRHAYQGPTDESNWVVPGRLMAGAYPGYDDDGANYKSLYRLVECGVTTFVCLQREYDAEVSERNWREGNALRPYFNDVAKIARDADKSIDFVHVGIEDCDVVDDRVIETLARQLAARLARDPREVLYVHCWGGHGRAGSLVCLLLHFVYSLDAASALFRCQFVHDCRRLPIVVGSPQTSDQRAQVCRVIARLIERDADDAAAAAADADRYLKDYVAAVVDLTEAALLSPFPRRTSTGDAFAWEAVDYDGERDAGAGGESSRTPAARKVPGARRRSGSLEPLSPKPAERLEPLRDRGGSRLPSTSPGPKHGGDAYRTAVTDLTSGGGGGDPAVGDLVSTFEAQTF